MLTMCASFEEMKLRSIWTQVKSEVLEWPIANKKKTKMLDKLPVEQPIYTDSIYATKKLETNFVK